MKAGRTSLTPLLAMLTKPRAAAKVDEAPLGALALIKSQHATGGTDLHTGRRRRDFYKGSK